MPPARVVRGAEEAPRRVVHADGAVQDGGERRHGHCGAGFCREGEVGGRAVEVQHEARNEGRGKTGAARLMV